MSLENGKLTPEQVSLPAILTPEAHGETNLEDMDLGEYATINASAVWYDGDGKCWLDGGYPLGLDVNEEYPSDYRVGVIRFYDGFVVEIFTPDDLPAQTKSLLGKWTDEQISAAFGEVSKLPVVAFVTTAEEFDTLGQIYQTDFGTKLTDVIKFSGNSGGITAKQPEQDASKKPPNKQRPKQT